MRVLLFENQPLLVEALTGLLEQLNDDMEIVLARDADELSREVGQDRSCELAFLGLPALGEQSVQTIRLMRRSASACKLVLFCDCTDRSRIKQCYAEGVDGIIPRDADRDIVLAATRLVLAGGQYLPPEVFAPGNDSRDQADEFDGSDEYRLTPQQRKVLALVAQGLSNKQIAHALSIAEGTVKLHVNAILKAMGVSNRTAAALLARERLDVPRPVANRY